MKLFVTGATGFLGRNILGKLGEEGHNTTGLLLPHEDAGGVSLSRVVRGDITQPETLAGKMEGHDAILHLAGAVGYGQTWEGCLKLNREGTANVAAEAARAGARRFVHMSSVSVYGRVHGVNVDEEHPRRKIGDPYGDTKIDAEEILEDYSERGDLDVTWIRPTVIYGLGDDKFLPRIIENLESGKARIIGTGENSVDVIHIRDVADFVSLVLREKKTIGRVYNLANPDNPTWRELMAGVATALGVDPPAKRLPYRLALAVAGGMEAWSKITGRPPRLTRYAVTVVGRQYLYETKRMAEELGFRPKISLMEGIRELLSGHL